MFKLVLEKADEPEIKLPTSTGSWKKQESSRKTSISALLTMPKPLTVWITINCGKFFKPGFNSTWTMNFQMFQLDLQKAEEPEIKLRIIEKSKRVPENHLLLLYWLCQSLWLCRSQQTVENSSRHGNTRPPYLSPEKPLCRSRSDS